MTRKTTAKLAQTLGLSETQVVHVALANLARRQRVAPRGDQQLVVDLDSLHEVT